MQPATSQGPSTAQAKKRLVAKPSTVRQTNSSLLGSFSESTPAWGEVTSNHCSRTPKLEQLTMVNRLRRLKSQVLCGCASLILLFCQNRSDPTNQPSNPIPMGPIVASHFAYPPLRERLPSTQLSASGPGMRTNSGTTKPTQASIAIRPCFSSASQRGEPRRRKEKQPE